MKTKNILLVLFTLFHIVSFTAILPQMPEGEFLIDPNPVYIPTGGNQDKSGIAFDGTNFLVVWEDYRTYPPDIYAARVTQDGLVLDMGGIPVCTFAEVQSQPSVEFDGTNYLVVWADYRDGNYDIYGARVTTDGSVLDLGGFVITNVGAGSQYPSVAFDGTNYLVVWEDYRSDRDIYGARVSTSGNVLDPTGIPICTIANTPSEPSVKFDGTNYLVVWQQYTATWETDIYGARVNKSGSVIDIAGFAISAAPDNQSEPVLAFDGTNYLVVWVDYAGYSADLYGARVNQSGTVLDPNGIAIRVTPDTISHTHTLPSIAFDGTNYLVVYYSSDDSQPYWDLIYGTRVTPAGNVLDPNGVFVCPVSATSEAQDLYPALAFKGTNYLIVWEHSPCDWYPYCYDIYGTRVTAELTVLDPQGIVASSDDYDFYNQWDPSAAFDGQNYFVVWEDDRVPPTSDIYGAFISSNASNPNPYIIIISTASDWQWFPAVVFGDSLYLVVWIDERSGNHDIYGARIKTNGEVLDPNGIEISTGSDDEDYPKVTFDGNNFLIVWEDERNVNDDIYCARVDQQGNLLDPNGILVSNADDDQRYPAVAFDGTNYLVVWEDRRSGVDDDVYGARVTPSGVVLDPNGIIISNATGHQEDPKVAFDGTNYLVVWDDERSGVDDVYGARVSPAGTVLDPNGIPISTASDQQEYASVVFNGTDFLVAWDDYRNYSDTADVYCAKVTTGGSVFQETAMVSGWGDQFYTSLAHGNGSQVLLAYNGWAEEHQGLTIDEYRVWGKFVGDPSSIDDETSTVPTEFVLYQNYPNPFNPSTTISYQLPKGSRVTIKIFNLLGEDIATLVNNEYQNAGTHSSLFIFNTSLPSGVYFYRIKAVDPESSSGQGFISTKKMILLK